MPRSALRWRSRAGAARSILPALAFAMNMSILPAAGLAQQLQLGRDRQGSVASDPAGSESGTPSPGTIPPARAPSSAALKRPLLKVGRLQLCLRTLDFYGGEIDGDAGRGTLAALRRYRDDRKMRRSSNMLHDFVLHAELWRECRTAVAEKVRLREQAALKVAAVQMQGSHGIRTDAIAPSGAPSGLPAGPGEAGGGAAHRAVCLPADLRDTLARARGVRSPTADACELPCLPLPARMSQYDAKHYERQWSVRWCSQCVPIASYLPLEEILRIEKSGNITLCSEVQRVYRGLETGGPVMREAYRGFRGLFQRQTGLASRHRDLAVVIWVSSYAAGLPAPRQAERNGSAIMALLTERMGFSSDSIIELKNPSLGDLERVFGAVQRGDGDKPERPDRRPEAELTQRLKAVPGANVVVYFAGLGAISQDQGEGFLLPADAVLKRESRSAYRLATLYEHLANLDAGSVTVLLEADFSRDAAGLLVAPNAPETRSGTLPHRPQAKLKVLTAAEGDQKPLEDPEWGLGLFTRYLVEGLSGAADVAPIGNADGNVDMVELYVFTAYKTAVAARKSFGVLQKPTLSQSQNAVLSRLGVPAAAPLGIPPP